MANELEGRKVAILIAPVGTEQVAFAKPEKAVEDAGAQVDVSWASRAERLRPQTAT
jgi:protease I